MKLTTGQRAAAFAAELIQGAFEASSFDGGEIQDLAVKHGLLRETTFDPKVHNDENGCAERGDPWFVYSRGMRLMRARRRAPTPPTVNSGDKTR